MSMRLGVPSVAATHMNLQCRAPFTSESTAQWKCTPIPSRARSATTAPCRASSSSSWQATVGPEPHWHSPRLKAAPTDAGPSTSYSAAGPEATASAAQPVPAPPATWDDGDVLRLQLADGRQVHAEVIATETSGRMNAARQVPRTTAAAGAAPQPGTSVQLLCQGARYTLYSLSPALKTTASVPAGVGVAGNGGVAQLGQAAADGAVLVLELTGAAMPPKEPLRAMIESPPKRHAAVLRAWAPLAARLVRAPLVQRPAATTIGTAVLQLPPQQSAAEPAALDGAAVVGAHRTVSLSGLRRQAVEQPGPWRDGSGPSESPLSEDARAVFTAGELACLLGGQRGVVLLQLHVGWDAHERVPPYGPYKPLVLRLLREALERPDIVSYLSAAPVPAPAAGSATASGSGGNPSYGLTLVLCADKEPFRSWGAHLAGFGCQAALEAQSPYYKLLIGRVLGYRQDHITHYIREKHGQEPPREVAAAVEQQLTKLSPKRPNLPWNTSSRGGGSGKEARKRAK